MRRSFFFSRLIPATLCLGIASIAQAATVRFTEDFTDDVSNWADNSGLALLSHEASGGPDGGAFAATDFSFLDRGGQDVVLFRAQDEFDSSRHAFEGNWIINGVGRFSTYVRHDAPQPLNFFTRFSGPGNFPGAVAVKFAPVLPNQWTLLEFNILPGNPEFVTFEGTSFPAVFSNIGHLQIGVSVPESLNELTEQLHFGIDKASLAALPSPAGGVLACLAILSLLLARVRRMR